MHVYSFQTSNHVVISKPFVAYWSSDCLFLETVLDHLKGEIIFSCVVLVQKKIIFILLLDINKLLLLSVLITHGYQK